MHVYDKSLGCKNRFNISSVVTCLHALCLNIVATFTLSMAASTSAAALISPENICTSNDGSHSLEDLLALSAAKDEGGNLPAKDLKVAGVSFPSQLGETICSDDGIPLGSTNAVQESTFSSSKAVVVSNFPGELTNIYDDAKDSLPSGRLMFIFCYFRS